VIGVSNPLPPCCVACPAPTSTESLSDAGRCPTCAAVSCGECDKGLDYNDLPCSCPAGEQRRVLARILEPAIRKAKELTAARVA
jgi:hypothetical protein